MRFGFTHKAELDFYLLGLLFLSFTFSHVSQAENGSSLFAAAALVSSATPAVVAGIDASAQESIAKTNAAKDTTLNAQNNAAAVAMAGMAAQNSMYNTLAQAQTAAIAQQGETDRLKLTLNAKSQTDFLQMRMQAMQFAAEYALKLQLLNLQTLQVKANEALSYAKSKLELMKAGLSNGSTPGDSGKLVATGNSGTARAIRSIDAYASSAGASPGAARTPTSLTDSIQSMQPSSRAVALPFARNPL